MLWSSSPTAVKQAALAGDQLHQLVLDAVRVLVLVDQDVAQALAPGVADLGVAREQRAGRTIRSSKSTARYAASRSS